MSATLQRMEDATAAILAGGPGTRLQPAVADRPKVLAEVNGRPFLFYVLDRLADVGIARTVVCTGYLGDSVAEAAAAYSRMHLVCSRETSPLGTAGALRRALPLVEPEHVFVLNGDSICTADLRSFWAWHCGKSARGSILLVKCSDAGRFGSVDIDYEGRVLAFAEKGRAGVEWINGGVYLFTKTLLETIPAGREVSLERDMFTQWIGADLYGYKSAGKLLDIGTPESYADAAAFLTGGRGNG